MGWEELQLDRIYFDSVTGVPGTTWPIGTPTVPSDVIADVILMCATRNLKVIDVHGVLTLGDTMEHYTFIGHRHEAIADTLALAGQDVDESTIISCLVSGAQGGTGFLTLTNCVVYLLTDFQGIANYCDLYGSAMSLKNDGFQDLHHCNSVHSDLIITVNAPTRASFKEMAGNCQFTGQTGGDLYIRGYKGTLIINAMTGGSCDIYANGADITITGTCTGGTINIYGNARVTDGHGGTCVVTDYTKETQLGAIKTETDQLPNTEHETEWATTAVVQQVVNAAAVNLTAGSITPTFPAGSTRVRAILIASIHAANQAVNTHHINIKVQGQKDVGGYGDLLDLTAQDTLGLVNLDAAGDGWCGAIDVTALVDASGSAYDFRFVVDSDNAGAVNYTTCFTLVLVYTM